MPCIKTYRVIFCFGKYYDSENSQVSVKQGADEWAAMVKLFLEHWGTEIFVYEITQI